MARDDWTGWRLLLVVWVVARLPMLLAAAFWLRDEIVSALERIVGLGAPTVIAISLVSTWPERALLFVPLAGTLAAGFLLAGRARSSALRFGLPIATAALGLVVVFVLFPRPWGLVLACALLLLIVPSVLPGGAIAAWIEAPGGRRIADVVFGLGVGVAEIALFKPLLIWLGTRLRSAREGLRWARSAPARLAMAAIVPGLAVLLLQGASLDGLRRALHADPAVAQMAEGNVYALEIDTERGILYASGKGFDHLQAFDVSGGGAAPRRSAARTGYAQDFALNLDDAEIYVYDKVTRSLVVLDAPSLETKQLFAGLDVSPGDSNIAWEPRLRRILIVSEADEEQVLPDGTLAREPGIPFVGLDRASGEIVNRLPFDPGNVLIHPTRLAWFMSFFRRTREVLEYDPVAETVRSRVATDDRLDQMAFDARTGELLVTSPLHSAVLRFDADRLTPSGRIPADFGVRALTIDPVRGWLVCGSIANNALSVIDLATSRRIARFYVAPWIHMVRLDPARGMAYVSATSGLYSVRYAAPPAR